MPKRLLSIPLAGCPPGNPSCPLPPLPSELVPIIQITTLCAIALLILAIVLAILNSLRGWRWSRFVWSGISLVGAGAFLFVANRAQDAWQPFAALHMPQDASYNDWAIRITSAALYNFAPTIVQFRSLMIVGCLVVLAMAITAIVHAARLIRQRSAHGKASLLAHPQ